MHNLNKEYENFFNSWMLKLFKNSNYLENQKHEREITFDEVNQFTDIFFSLYVIFDRLSLEIALNYISKNENEKKIYNSYSAKHIKDLNKKFNNNKDRYFFESIDKGNIRNYLKKKCKGQINYLVEIMKQRKFIVYSNIITGNRDKFYEEQIITDITEGEKKGAEKYLISLKRILAGIRNNIFHGHKTLNEDQICILVSASQIIACWNFKLANQCGLSCEKIKIYFE